MPTQEQLEALQKIAEAAVVAETVTGCPAELSAAQCIQESDWLYRAPGNNCFGIKATDSDVQYCVTKEFLDGTWMTKDLAFEAYPTLYDCFIAHARLIVGGKSYVGAFQQYQQNHDLDKFIARVAMRYATDPGYSSAIMQLAHGPHVTAAIAAARARMHPGDAIVQSGAKA